MVNNNTVKPRDLFSNSYNNRYTWDSNFKGYKGECVYINSEFNLDGAFRLEKNNAKVYNIGNENVNKLITKQLWEYSIHRQKRSFESIHGDNIFKYGNSDNNGQEILVEGKSNGDKYCIHDNKINMVYRHIHSTIVEVYSSKFFDTDQGYLSSNYTSQYYDPKTKEPLSGLIQIKDDFLILKDNYIALKKREVINNSLNRELISKELFKFNHIELL